MTHVAYGGASFKKAYAITAISGDEVTVKFIFCTVYFSFTSLDYGVAVSVISI